MKIDLNEVQLPAVDQMAARRSFSRSVSKFELEVVGRPVAVLTAFQGTVKDARGRGIADTLARLACNRKANAQLAQDLKNLNLGFYPVKGAGQEERQRLFGLVRYVLPSIEESFIIQPTAEMPEETFVSAIHRLVQSTASWVLP